jgi:hypothetical protein
MNVLQSKPLPATIKVGDHMTRVLGGVVKMPVTVGAIDSIRVWVGAGHAHIDADNAVQNGWCFLRSTGGEVDDDLKWDGVTKTGSYLIK